LLSLSGAKVKQTPSAPDASEIWFGIVDVLLCSYQATMIYEDGAADLLPPGRKKTRVSKHRVGTPKWMHNNDQVLKFILRVFPNYQTDARQKERARDWADIIFKFFLGGMSARQIAEELGRPTSAVERIIQRIRLAAAHRRQDGKTRTGRRKGRPRKAIPRKTRTTIPIPTP
jgi:hypothetical protein